MMWAVVCSVMVLPLVVTDGYQCYLEDVSASCPVCWITNSNGVRTMGQCPASIQTSWNPPTELIAGDAYEVDFSIWVNQTSLDVVRKSSSGSEPYDVSHANIHSCVAHRGACTPFVANSPGLATHTKAASGNFDAQGFAFFTARVELTPETYTIIAHYRFYTPDISRVNYTMACDGMCYRQYDVAMGASADVKKKENNARPSNAALIAAGALGVVLLVLTGSFLWASHFRRLSVETMLVVIFNQPVCIVCNMVLSFSSVTSFTYGFVHTILEDEALVQMIPFAYLFVVISWLTVFYCSFRSGQVLIGLMKKSQNRFRFGHKRAKSFYIKSMKTEAKSNDVTPRTPKVGDIKKFSMELVNTSEGIELILDYYKANNHYRVMFSNLVSLALVGIPLSCINGYVLLVSSSRTHANEVTVLSFVLSSILIGIKISSISGIGASKQHLDKMKKYLEAFRKSRATHDTTPKPSSKISKLEKLGVIQQVALDAKDPSHVREISSSNRRDRRCASGEEAKMDKTARKREYLVAFHKRASTLVLSQQHRFQEDNEGSRSARSLRAQQVRSLRMGPKSQNSDCSISRDELELASSLGVVEESSIIT
uniref:Uncharacterized protein n=1 Tax=Lotharella oceanica TaxID=641309 RepID=A0A7S2XFV7_9EUKA|mmetsp:Transcript_37606/g.69353  ORF Transcript_37606/g.69353 Transcript_37606/m.69353 type:complete len:596 (+) Transcript_37606:1-1788(+)